MVGMRADKPDTTWLRDIEIIAGHPALDFLNTVHSRTEPTLRDYLITPDHLFAWCLHMHLIDAAQADAFAALPDVTALALLDDARTLRHTLHQTFDDHLQGRRVDAALQQLNRELASLNRFRHMASVDPGFAWQCDVSAQHPRSLLAPLAFAAAELLASTELQRVKACPPPQGCGWLFVDRSRNHSRTWCSMKTCGNLAKQHRHRARQNTRD